MKKDTKSKKYKPYNYELENISLSSGSIYFKTNKQKTLVS